VANRFEASPGEKKTEKRERKEEKEQQCIGAAHTPRSAPIRATTISCVSEQQKRQARPQTYNNIARCDSGGIMQNSAASLSIRVSPGRSRREYSHGRKLGLSVFLQKPLARGILVDF